MSNYKRLHPITAISNFLKELKQLIAPIIIFFFIGRGDHKESIWEYSSMFFMVLMILIVLITGIVKWRRFTYRLEEGELRIEYGLLVKKKRYIPFERIQSLDLSEGILHRPFGLVKVKIETAGSNMTEAEAELTAIKKSEADEIQRIISEAKKSSPKIETNDAPIDFEQSDTIIYQISKKEMFIMASTSGGAGVIVSALLAFFSQFNEMIPYEKIFKELSHLVESGVFLIIFLIVLLLLAAWIGSILVTLIKYNGFTTKQNDGNLIITRGLLERRQTTIPLHRIQAVRITENPLRQLWGYASVYIESAGGSVADKESMNVVLIPIVKKSKIPSILDGTLTGYNFNTSFHKAPGRAKNRYMIREILKVFPVSAGLAIAFWPFGLISIILLGFFAVYGHLRFRSAGWSIEQEQLSLRFRGLLKHTIFMKKNRIQSMMVKQSWFQRKLQLASIFSTVKSSGSGKTSKVFHLDLLDVEKIYQWYRQ
ncbi:PH domain-containing protein [Heyndrickxia vini]|uniref:PH domain-containing protein n=1 Tax=Heyndrickxia vini TaxID=1476025 RepID=A0ABX7E0W2_9BACI|nr:PH domain-containing protein [Heyndrickxia vini]QQZ09167.1 PH domain-containing protein [Heyndrickxia vini]